MHDAVCPGQGAVEGEEGGVGGGGGHKALVGGGGGLHARSPWGM